MGWVSFRGNLGENRASADVSRIMSETRIWRLHYFCWRQFGFPLITKLMTLNDLERRNDRYFALVHWTRSICRLITSMQLKLEHMLPYCLQQNCRPKNLVTSGDFLGDNWGCVKERYPTRQRKFYTFARPSQQQLSSCTIAVKPA